MLGDVVAVHRWLPGFVATRMEGDLRFCTMADGTEVREEIVDTPTGHADEVTVMVAGAFQESLDALGGYLAADAYRSA